MCFRRLLTLLLVINFWTLPLYANEADRFVFSTGGILRTPNSQQPSDEGNAYFEGWIKASWRLGDTPLSLFLRGKKVTDQVGYPFNNHDTLGLGVALKGQLGDRASLTLSIRHDFQEREPEDRRGTRVLLDYFFLDYHVPDEPLYILGLVQKAKVSIVYANFTFPETLRENDLNLTFSGGVDMSISFNIPQTQMMLAPYTALHIALDSDQNNWNNKAQPSFGIKIKQPLPGGDIHLGLRYQGDYRWINKEYRDGPSVFIGWYSAF